MDNDFKYALSNESTLITNSIIVTIFYLFRADLPFLSIFWKFQMPSEILGNLGTSSQISENFGRFLTTCTGFGPIPNIIYDKDVFFIVVVSVEKTS